MKVRPINAVVEYVRETRTAAGTVHRTTTLQIDVTKKVLSLDLDAIRRLGDTNPASLKFAKPLVEGEVIEVWLLRSILDHFGVDRMREITDADLSAARHLTGLIRKRTRPQFATAA